MKKQRSVLTTIAFVLAFLLLFVQGILAVFRYWFQLEFNNPLLFYGINVGIVCLATLAIAPYINRRILFVLSGILLVLQGFAMYVGAGTRSIASESPDGTHLFLVQAQPNGQLTYRRDLYYQIPQLQRFLPVPSLTTAPYSLSANGGGLNYSLGDDYKIDWVDDYAIFSYETPDGGLAQYVRDYDDNGQQTSEDWIPQIINNWTGSDATLAAQGLPYDLRLSKETIALNPDYLDVTGKAGSFTDEQGNALCTLILSEDGNQVTYIPANPRQKTTYMMTTVNKD